MRTTGAFAIAVALLSVVGCGTDVPASTELDSGVTGQVHLGPQCPVETVDDPCEDQPAAHVSVTVSEQLPGEPSGAGKVVARGETDADGAYRVAVAPGDYVVTAEAGMSCESMDAQVSAGAYRSVDVPCDTGIR